VQLVTRGLQLSTVIGLSFLICFYLDQSLPFKWCLNNLAMDLVLLARIDLRLNVWMDENRVTWVFGQGSWNVSLRVFHCWVCSDFLVVWFDDCISALFCADVYCLSFQNIQASSPSSTTGRDSWGWERELLVPPPQRAGTAQYKNERGRRGTAEARGFQQDSPAQLKSCEEDQEAEHKL